jgi:hypothetical protein
MRKRPWFSLLIGVALGLAGCSSLTGGREAGTAPSAAPFKPQNFVGDNYVPRSLRRVVILPVHGGQIAPPECCEYLDSIFATSLERQARFEVVVLTREECGKMFGVPDFASTDSLPPDFLSKLATEYAAQGVMFVDITAFAPYRPLSIGVRAKLATVADRRLIWSFDEVFTCLDPSIVAGLRKYYLKNNQSAGPVDLAADALVSPRLFAVYAADTAFQTLPRR